MTDLILALKARALTAQQFSHLAGVAPEIERLANIPNAKTRHAHKEEVNDFSHFTGLQNPVELQTIMRHHVIAWRNIFYQLHSDAAVLAISRSRQRRTKLPSARESASATRRC